jgi:Tfp pilus assembly protein FimT
MVLGATRMGMLPSVDPYLPTISTSATNIYIPDSFTASSWNDYLGNNNSSSVQGTPALQSTSGNAATKIDEEIQFSTSAGFQFSNMVVGNSSTYTFFGISRYRSGTNGRIFNGQGQNWLLGHWNGREGVAYYGGWLSSTDQSYGTDWVLCVSQPSYAAFYSDGNTRTISGGAASGSPYMTINHNTQSNEPSTCAVYGMWYYDSTLSASDRDEVVTFLKDLAGIS